MNVFKNIIKGLKVLGVCGGALPGGFPAWHQNTGIRNMESLESEHQIQNVDKGPP